MSEINVIKNLTEGIYAINLKLVDQYQRKDPSLMYKYNKVVYKISYFNGGINIYLNLITCKTKTVIPLILQGYILNWYHTHRLHPRMDITEVMIHQHLQWTSIRKTVRKKVSNFDTCQHTKWSNKKYDKFPAKESE